MAPNRSGNSCRNPICRYEDELQSWTNKKGAATIALSLKPRINLLNAD
jgi:hypothetical protein